MGKEDIIDRLRKMAESPVYALRRGVLLTSAQNLEALGTENKRLRTWIENLEMSARMESDTIRIKKFEAIKAGKTLEQVLEGK